MLTPIPTTPMKIIHIDTFLVAGQTFLTLFDAFLKYGQACHPIDNANAVNIIKSLLILSLCLK